jgi:hypothetical protein
VTRLAEGYTNPKQGNSSWLYLSLHNRECFVEEVDVIAQCESLYNFETFVKCSVSSLLFLHSIIILLQNHKLYYHIYVSLLYFANYISVHVSVVPLFCDVTIVIV